MWRSVREVQKRNSVELELDDEEVPSLIDVIDAFRNGTREHEQQMFETGIKFSAGIPGRDVMNLYTREVLAPRMNEARSTIAREMRAVRMSTIDIPLHVVTQVLQLAGQQAATRETDELIEEIYFSYCRQFDYRPYS